MRARCLALGWAGALCLGALAPAWAGDAIEVTVGTLNTRTGPSTRYAVAGQVHRGEVYAVVARSGSWVRFQFDHRTTWSYAPYTRGLSRTVHKVNVSSALNVRSGPSTGYRVLGTLPRGAKVVVQGSSGSWRKISYRGQGAWVHGNYLVQDGAATSPPPTSGGTNVGTPTHVVNASVLNLRKGPSTGYGIIAQLARGDRVRSIGTSGSWRNVVTAKGTGWVYGRYVSALGPGGVVTSSAGFINLPASGPGFRSYKSAYRRWGTPTMVYGIQRAARRWSGETPSRPRWSVGDISKENGGYFPPHVSHRYGKDVDIWPVRNDGREASTDTRWGSYSRSLTRRALDLLRAELPEKLILFNDTAIPGVKWYSGHYDHFHLRTWR